ncbi:amino acid adenylation domain-containing protein [Streptomyces sp. NBC_00872]|uniref:amino acid adenylation domain-containing protein n=1 Tax=Streptomyces sp. NBC_00872 TaxID=2903686 RepID=UPI00386A05D9|nr:amino acid adenylation domain-containing protein [Streptomyces sp. NBC_00872]
MTETETGDRTALRQELLRQRLRGRAAPPRNDGIGRAPRGGPLPLSFAQRRLWILDQLQPGSTEYLMTAALRLRGELDPAALRTALDGTAARHEVLRTRYPVVDDEPVQLIDEPGPVPLTELDLRGVDRERADARLAALVTSERLPVDLATGPVLSAVLVRLDEDEHALLLTFHHIASDGWSEDLLVAEVAARYGDAVAGRPTAEPQAPLQYADFAVWQRERLSGELLERQLVHWRERLAGLEPLELPTDRPRPAVRDVAGAQVPLKVPAEVAGRLTALARDHGATPFMALTAAYAVLLGRWSGQRDVAVGTPVAGRDRPEVQDMAGLFLNTLVLRTDLSGSPSFTEVLRRVREAALDAYAHQEVPFERLVDELAPERDPSRTPLFSAMLLWQEESASTAGPRTMGPLTVGRLPVGESTAKFDLTLGVSQLPDGSLSGALNYASALFDRETAERFTAHFARLLESATAEPALPVDELEILPPAERGLLLEGWNDTARPYPSGTLPALFEAQAARTPDATALRYEGTAVSYARLAAEAGRLAGELRERGVGPESVVGVCLPRGTGLMVALLAVMKAGGAYLPLDPEYPRERLGFMLDDSAATVVVTDAGLAALVSGGDRQFVDIDADRSGPSAPAGTGSWSGPAPEHPAYVIYTSGSTGRPKGVVVEHRAIVNRLHWMQEAYGLTGADRVLQKTPYGFDVSVWEFFWPLTTGATLVLARPGGHRDPAYLAGVIAAEGVTTLHFVPSMLRAFLAGPLPPLPTLRRMICSGEALPADLVTAVHERIGCELHNLYGPTEAAVDVTAARCAPGLPVTIGRPIANTRTYIVDDGLRPVPVGVPGELLLGGVQLARGYLGRPALTAERFVPSPFATAPGERLYRTGDLARYRTDGTIEYLGRLDHQVKIRGQRVELGEIEAVLTECAGVDSVAVTLHDERLVAHLTPVTADVAAVREELRGKLPEHMCPAHWMLLDALPLTTSGKVDRKALPAPDDTRSLLAGEYTAPRDALERTLAEAFAAALGVDKVGVHDSFFQLGGDSLRAIRAVGRLREQGFEVSVHDMFTRQRVAELAELVRSRPRPDGGTAGPVAADVLVERFALVGDEDRARLPEGLDDAYPMAQTQAGMVYEMLAATDRAVYQNVSCYKVRDELPFDPAALTEAARTLVARNEILRTSFDLSGYSEAMQLVHREAELPIGFDDLRSKPAEDQRAVVDGFLVGERRKAFDLGRPPLLRYHVHQISDEEWWLTHIEAHAILDGWSHTSVVAELISLYRTVRQGRTPDLPPPPNVRFADFVALERAALASEEDRAFWAERIGGSEKFELPPAWGSQEQDEKATIIDVPYRDLLPGLRRLAAAAGGSLKSVLHAAHLRALGVVTGRRRFHTGLVCNGRPELARGDEVRGLYLNTVPFAADLSAPTWRELVRDVFAGEAALWPHRRYPMPAMQREWGTSPTLIDVAFGFLDFHVLDWESDEVGMVDDFSPSELALEVWTFPGVLRLGGRPSLVGRAQLELLGRVYRHVLEAMAADPDGDAYGLTLPPADHDRTVHDGNDTARPVPADLLVHELAAAQARSTPHSVALRYGDETVGYRALDERAERLARRLRALGVGPDTIVGLYLPRTPDLIVALLATLKAGGAFLPLDPEYPAERLRHMLTDAAVTVLLSTRALRTALPSGVNCAVETVEDLPEGNPPGGSPSGGSPSGGSPSGEDLPGGEVAAPDPGGRASLDSLAYVIYTSGSTGLPKGVGVPHRGPLNLRYAQREHLDVREGDRVLQFASPSFDAFVWEVIMALTNGAELVLPPPDTDPGDLRQQAGLVTHMTLPPSLLDRLAPSDFPHLRVLVSAGEACSAEQAARWSDRVTFINAYGPTETSVCATLAPVPPRGSGPARVSGPPSMGRPIGNFQVYVLDADLRPVADGVQGELYVGGAGLARGYLNRPHLTAERFVPDPYGGRPGDRLYRTGDLVSRNTDGTLQYHGRRDHQVKVRGLRAEPGEIENLLLGHPAVAAAVVTVHRAGTADATLVAYAETAEGRTAEPAELREHLRGRVPKGLLPTHYFVLDAFPLTPAGKTDRAALPVPDGARPALMAPYVAPSGELEEAIADAWSEALTVERVGAHDDFFELGGHSLALMRIVATLRARHGLELRFRSFIEHRTVAGLAASIESARNTSAPEGEEATRAMLWIREKGNGSPLFFVHPGGGSAHWYLRLAPHLRTERPVAAFEWPGPHTSASPPTAEEMAERYLTELRALQPAGPYVLFSWCGGSGIASEMASRLVGAGEEVTFMLLDPGLDAHERAEGWRELALIRRLERLVDEVARGGADADTPERRAEILDLLNHLVDDVDEETGITLPDEGVGEAWPRAARIWREVMEMDLAYRHRPFPGRLHLIVSDELAQGEHEVAFGQTFEDYLGRWRELLTEGVRVHRVPGDHFGVMKPPHVSRLAEVMDAVIAGSGSSDGAAEG